MIHKMDIIKLLLFYRVTLMKKLYVIGAISLALGGCASIPTNYMPSVKQISKPEIGSTQVANLGDQLLIQGTTVERQALYFEAPQKTGMGVTIHQGHYAKRGENAQYEYMMINHESGAGQVTDPLGMPILTGIALRKADNAICIINMYGGVVNCKTGLNFKKVNWVSVNNNSFQQTLIYNGKIGNKINIAYREFSSDLARPAFNNEVEYDLSESNQIGYKGALLEVIEANNLMIKYKVIKNFNTQ